MRVLLVDAHHLVRAGIKRLLDALPDVEVIGESGSLQRAFATADSSRTDAVMLDPKLPDAPPTGAIVEFRRRLPRAGVLAFSPHGDAASVRRALADGALGYLTYDSAPAELGPALTAVSHHQSYISPLVSQRLSERRVGGIGNRAQLFSARQREVLRLIGQGKATRDIARALGVSVKTVETHRARLMETLNVRGSAGLMRYALAAGMG